MTSRELTSLTVLACILVISSSGCLTFQPRNSTSSLTTIAQSSGALSASNSSLSNAPTSVSLNPTGDLNVYFSENAVIVIPFKRVTVGDRATFIGTVKDKRDNPPRMQHNLIYLECYDKTDADAQVQILSNIAQSRGYVRSASVTSDNVTYWFGHKGGPTDFVVINTCERGRCETGLGRIYTPSFATPMVAVDYVSESY